MANLKLEKYENIYKLSIENLDGNYGTLLSYQAGARYIYNIQFYCSYWNGTGPQKLIINKITQIADKDNYRINSIDSNENIISKIDFDVKKDKDQDQSPTKIEICKIEFDFESNLGGPARIDAINAVIQWADYYQDQEYYELDKEYQANIFCNSIDIKQENPPSPTPTDKSAQFDFIDLSNNKLKWRIINLDTSYDYQNRYIELEYAILTNKQTPESTDLIWIKMPGYYGSNHEKLDIEELFKSIDEIPNATSSYFNRIFSYTKTAPGLDNDYYLTNLEYELSKKRIALRAIIYYYYEWNGTEYSPQWYNKIFLYENDITIPNIKPDIISDGTGISSYKAFYPPILEPTQPAFIAKDTNKYKIYFSLSELTNYNDIGHIGFIINKVADNSSIINEDEYPDQVIYKSIGEVEKAGNNLYYVEIKNSELKTKWKAGEYYKVQARLGLQPLLWKTRGLSTFSDWKSTQIQNGYFSEWSTVMVLKAIAKPYVSIINDKSAADTASYFDYLKDLNVEVFAAENSQSPLFIGAYKCDDITEWVEEYRFKLYDQDGLLEDSGWHGHDKSDDELKSSTDRHTFNTLLQYDKTYTVEYYIRTNNLYEGMSSYSFTIYWNKNDDSFDGYLTGKPNEEEGTIELYLKGRKSGDNTPEGTFFVMRTDYGSNLWESIGIVTFTDNIPMSETKIFDDFLIEYGKKYLYALQYYDVRHDRRGQTIANIKDPIWCYFEHSYLYCNGKQLKIKFNPTINSFKHTVLEQKQDTLGRKYPTILRNGYAYYAEFPIGGMISLHSDENANFFDIHNEDKDRYMYPDRKKYDKLKDNKIEIGKSVLESIDFTKQLNGNYIDHIREYLKGIPYNPAWDPELEPKDWQETEYQNSSSYEIFNTNLTNENIYIEKDFRNEAESFLNNGGYKLFKSPTEGNFIVTLMTVQFQPQTTLGRMLYSFTTNAYEIDEYSISNMKNIR